MNHTILSSIQKPKDLQSLSKQDLCTLAAEMRHIILETVGLNGGHLASNLGVIELTIALHRVFSSPEDAIIWDVGHQSYPHKLLTGRYGAFSTLRLKDGLSGFPKREESPHDIFNTGHASTSISAAEGILAGKRLQKHSGKVIAVIGDGALSGGMACEALLNVTPQTKGLIVILNDNNMSISPNIRAISEYLSRLTVRKGYQRFKYLFDNSVDKIPFLGRRINFLIRRLKRGAKGMLYKTNLFTELGFEYVGPLNGHYESELEKVFRNVKDIDTPVLIHVQTKKGKGYSFAEDNPAAFHGIGPFSLTDGKVEKNTSVSFTEAFSQAVAAAASEEEKITAITAAMAQGTGLHHFQRLYPQRFFDVGIAEQHAVTFAAGLAAAGLRPVAAIYSTFLQRSIDQIIHDVALQKLPVIFAIDRAGAVPYDGETHQGLYDISLLRTIPNMTILSPASAAELQVMFRWMLTLSMPAAMRYPKNTCPPECSAFALPIESGRGVFPVETENSQLLLVCTGGMYPEAAAAAHILLRRNIAADIYNLRFLKPVDESFFLDFVQKKYRAVLFIEDGAYIGGIGHYLEALIQKHCSGIKTQVCAFSDEVMLQGARQDILESAGLTGEQLAETAAELYKSGL
ncbi:MAG: 1-deoxy-D-xylulose-5-phosphate synthase [Treponema sp.]